MAKKSSFVLGETHVEGSAETGTLSPLHVFLSACTLDLREVETPK